MKRLNLRTMPAIFCFAILFAGCVKDKISHTYKVLRPVYKSVDLVRSELGSEQPRAIKNAGKIFVKGDYIYLNEVDKGVHIIDNSNPAAPINISFINIAGNVDLAVKGNVLYADMFKDMVVFDISKPLEAKVKKIIPNAFPERTYTNGIRPGNNQYIVDWTIKDTVVAVEDNMSRSIPFSCPNCSIFLSSSMANPAISAGAVGIAGSMARFALVNDFLYTVSTSTLSVYNVEKAEDPVFLKQSGVGWNIETLFPMKDKLLMGSSSGVFIFDISSPQTPVRLSQFTHMTACDPVVASGNTAFVTLRSGARCVSSSDQLDVLDISDIRNPVLHKTYAMKNPKGLSVDENLLFICDDGLKVYNTVNLKDLILLEHKTGFESYDVITTNKIAIVVTKDGILQYKYSPQGKLTPVSAISWEH